MLSRPALQESGLKPNENGTPRTTRVACECCPFVQNPVNLCSYGFFVAGNGGIHSPFTEPVEVCESQFLGRSFRRKTNFSPDQTSSTAQTFTSTIPWAKPMARTTSSVRSLATPELFFGHEIQSIPAGVSFSAFFKNVRSNSRFVVTNSHTKSNGLRPREFTVTLGGNSNSRSIKPAGALIKSRLQPSLIPSFLASGVAE